MRNGRRRTRVRLRITTWRRAKRPRGCLPAGGSPWFIAVAQNFWVGSPRVRAVGQPVDVVERTARSTLSNEFNLVQHFVYYYCYLFKTKCASISHAVKSLEIYSQCQDNNVLLSYYTYLIMFKVLNLTIVFANIW